MNSEHKARLIAARAGRAAHVLAWQQSALTQAAYCAQHGINPTTFSGWRLAKPGAGASALTAVPIHIAPPNVRNEQSSSPQPVVGRGHTLHSAHGTRGWTLELATDTTPRWLAQLLREIEATVPTQMSA